MSISGYRKWIPNPKAAPRGRSDRGAAARQRNAKAANDRARLQRIARQMREKIDARAGC